MVHCNRCGAWTCRSCIRSLRVAARAEALRCKHLRVLQYDALLWLMAERASAKDLFDPEQSGGVLVADAGGVLHFSCESGCMFCGEAVLQVRARPFSRIPPALSYPLEQPREGKRDIFFVKVRSPLPGTRSVMQFVCELTDLDVPALHVPVA